MDPNDSTNKKDLEAYEQVINWEKVVVRHVEKNDYPTAVEYLNQILGECPASEKHSIQKIECLLKSSLLTEAEKFTQTLVQ